MGKKIKLPLEIGLAAICKRIRAVKQTAEQSGSAVSALAQATAESVEEIEGILNEKQDASVPVPITIPATGWGGDSTSGWPKYYDIAVSGVTANDYAAVTLSPAGLITAAACNLCPACETLAGKVRIRAEKVPAAAIAAQCRIEKGAQV